jgi:hypothetical protein
LVLVVLLVLMALILFWVLLLPLVVAQEEPQTVLLVVLVVVLEVQVQLFSRAEQEQRIKVLLVQVYWFCVVVRTGRLAVVVALVL